MIMQLARARPATPAHQQPSLVANTVLALAVQTCGGTYVRIEIASGAVSRILSTHRSKTKFPPPPP